VVLRLSPAVLTAILETAPPLSKATWLYERGASPGNRGGLSFARSVVGPLPPAPAGGIFST